MFSRKMQAEEIPEALTDIWSCSSSKCKSWMREEFAFETNPVCPTCRSPMERETKMLPLLSNTGIVPKFAKKNKR